MRYISWIAVAAGIVLTATLLWHQILPGVPSENPEKVSIANFIRELEDDVSPIARREEARVAVSWKPGVLHMDQRMGAAFPHSRTIGGRVMRPSGEAFVGGLVEVIPQAPGSIGDRSVGACETDAAGSFRIEVTPEMAPGPLVYIHVSGKYACLFEGHVESREDLQIVLTENEEDASWILSGRVSIDPLPNGERWCVDLLAERGRAGGVVSEMLASSMMDGGSVVRSALVQMPFVDVHAKQYEGAVWLVARSLMKRNTIAAKRFESIRELGVALQGEVVLAPRAREVTVVPVGTHAVTEVMCISRDAGGSGFSAVIRDGRGSMVVSEGSYLLRGRCQNGAFGEKAIAILEDGDIVIEEWDYVYPGAWPLAVKIHSQGGAPTAPMKLEMARTERLTGATLETKRYDLVELGIQFHGLSAGLYRIGVYSADRSCFGECEVDIPNVASVSVELKDVCAVTVQPRQSDAREYGIADGGDSILYWKSSDATVWKRVSREEGFRNACVIPMVSCGSQIDVVVVTRRNREKLPWFGRARCQVPHSHVGVLEVPIQLASEVSGRLVNRDGIPVPRCRVAFQEGNAVPQLACETRSDGTFDRLLLPLLTDGQRVGLKLIREDGTSVLIDCDPSESSVLLVDPDGAIR